MDKQHIEGIPDGYHTFHTWDDGNTFYSLNTETKTVGGYYMVEQSCGCCSEPHETEWDWEDLNETAQRLIREEIQQTQEK